VNFELDEIIVERGVENSALARRVIAASAQVTCRVCDDVRAEVRPRADDADPFGAGKRRFVISRRRAPFLMACPGASAQFACCGYLVAILASNCPMDCSYCFLQEHVADNPAFQIFANYPDLMGELDAVIRSAPSRSFRVGTGELADSLAFDSITGIARDLVEMVRERGNITIEFKTKTDEIDGLLEIDPRGRAMVSWTMTPTAVWKSSEHRTASPSARIAAARRVIDAGYRVGFHFDPLIAYENAERDYSDLIDELFDSVAPSEIAFVSIGGLRMTPALKRAARARHPNDPMLLGEDVPAPDGRLRTFTPRRIAMYRMVAEKLRRAGAVMPAYLCMESQSVHERVFGTHPPSAAQLGSVLATA
jgi:spore photoproduct lyase